MTLSFVPIWIFSFAISWAMHEANAIDDALAAISVSGILLVGFCAIPFGIIGMICTVTKLKDRFRYHIATPLLSLANIILGAIVIGYVFYAASHM